MTDPTTAPTPPPPPAREEIGREPGERVSAPAAELAVRGHCDVPANLGEMMRLAEHLAESDILPSHLRRRPANVLTMMLAARALDIPLWTAFQALYLIEGKVGMDATFQRALVVRAGHTFRVIEKSADQAVVEIVRHDDPAHPRRTRFTWGEAVVAGLATRDIWGRYRRAMLFARATTAAIRDHTPEVLFTSAYTPEELDMAVDELGTPVTIIPSERVHPGPAPGGRRPGESEALRATYDTAIAAAGSRDELNSIWSDATRDGVLDAPLPDGTPVRAALHARAAHLDAAARLADPAGSGVQDRAAEPPGDAEVVWDAEIVGR